MEQEPGWGSACVTHALCYVLGRFDRSLSQELTWPDLHFLKLSLATVWTGNWREAREISKESVCSFIHQMFIYYYVYLSGTGLGAGRTARDKQDKVPNLREL